MRTRMPKEITPRWLKAKGACLQESDPGVQWYQKQGDHSPVVLLAQLRAENHLDWANWLLVRLMARDQCVAYAVFAARQVLYIYEHAYPEDMRPRRAIEAAEACLKAKGSAAGSAESAARSAAESAEAAESAAAEWSAESARSARSARSAAESAAAAWSAESAAAAGSAESAARSAAESAESAESAAAARSAWSAESAAAWSARSAATYQAMLSRIVDHGITLLEKEEKGQ